MSDPNETKLPYPVMPPEPLPNPPYEYQQGPFGSGATSCATERASNQQFDELKNFRIDDKG